MVDKEEEEGLRAFALNVGAYARTSSPERPLWVEHGGVRLDVDVVEAQWREEERLGFRVRLADGSHALLYYVPELDLWSGALAGNIEIARVRKRGGGRHVGDD